MKNDIVICCPDNTCKKYFYDGATCIMCQLKRDKRKKQRRKEANMDKDMFLAKLVNMNYSQIYSDSSLDKFGYVKKYMERELPEVWESYLEEMAHMTCHANDDTNSFIGQLNAQLNMDNLINYLSKYREWGIKKCPKCGVIMDDGTINSLQINGKKCSTCHGSGTRKHPALVYLEEEDEQH